MKPSILAIADSDSYLKLATAFLDRLGPTWHRRVALVRTPVMPTEEQIAAAFEGTSLDPDQLEFLTMQQLNANSIGEDIVFAAATGPVVAEAYSRILRSEPAGARRTALISALPGVAFPATAKGWNYRRAGDAFICHSHAEARDFSFMNEERPGHQPTIMVSKLPFLRSTGFPPAQHEHINRIVFAPQAKVPLLREERESILLALEKTARLNPGIDVVVKLRARAGEPQTHLEQFPYDVLAEDLAASGQLGPQSHLRFDTGSMSEALSERSALVTVSSTAALESIDRGLPTMILDDFGISPEMINTVFQASGLIGNLQSLSDLQFGSPTKAWLRENYFHRVDGSFIDALNSLASRASEGKLQTNQEVLDFIKNQPMRQRLRTVLPTPIVKILQKLRRSFNKSRGFNANSWS
ncbi:DUF6716 putative glycosyltransferase [Glutamicibacter sp.]|uniref:DUF6716 putative glycosyltransferase n=1 Tax=Glutamicibacter sp. TaxID=1931995 RepID=UPI0028BF1ABB|nr:DUF6716 putative glycosyltransferase [Glutamicibacter sp.]